MSDNCKSILAAFLQKDPKRRLGWGESDVEEVRRGLGWGESNVEEVRVGWDRVKVT